MRKIELEARSWKLIYTNRTSTVHATETKTRKERGGNAPVTMERDGEITEQQETRREYTCACMIGKERENKSEERKCLHV